MGLLYFYLYFFRYLFNHSFKSTYFCCLFSPSALRTLRTPISLAVPHLQFCFLLLLTHTERLAGSHSLYLQCEIPKGIFIVKQ
jgi:hypothetical protein